MDVKSCGLIMILFDRCAQSFAYIDFLTVFSATGFCRLAETFIVLYFYLERSNKKKSTFYKTEELY